MYSIFGKNNISKITYRIYANKDISNLYTNKHK